jgi:hypothetical protein
MGNPRKHPGYTQAGKACTASIEEWRVVDYMCNYSAFNGYRHTSSPYSSLKCNRCGERWRTKAKYVSLVIRNGV